MNWYDLMIDLRHDYWRDVVVLLGLAGIVAMATMGRGTGSAGNPTTDRPPFVPSYADQSNEPESRQSAGDVTAADRRMAELPQATAAASPAEADRTAEDSAALWAMSPELWEKVAPHSLEQRDARGPAAGHRETREGEAQPEPAAPTALATDASAPNSIGDKPRALLTEADGRSLLEDVSDPEVVDELAELQERSIQRGDLRLKLSLSDVPPSKLAHVVNWFVLQYGKSRYLVPVGGVAEPLTEQRPLPAGILMGELTLPRVDWPADLQLAATKCFGKGIPPTASFLLNRRSELTIYRLVAGLNPPPGSCVWLRLQNTPAAGLEIVVTGLSSGSPDSDEKTSSFAGRPEPGSHHSP
jgi:hypothetical protein